MRYYFSSAYFEVGRMEQGVAYETRDISECTTVVDRDGDREVQPVDWLRFLRMTKLDEDKRILFDSAHLVAARCQDGRVEISWDGSAKEVDSEFCSLKISKDKVSLTKK